MQLALWALGGGIVLEALAYELRPIWRTRRLLVPLVVLIQIAASAALFWNEWGVFAALLTLLSIYSGLNALRILKARMHEGYLHRAARRTGLVFCLLQSLVIAGWFVWTGGWLDTVVTWTALAIAQLAVALSIAFTVGRRLMRTRWPARVKELSDSQLPTVSVAIPARNETADLEACLKSVLASDYPKLEVLVLDDCSQGKQTSEIIRSFAHEGVRFLQGKEPDETWLPKNRAYDYLAREASGEYLLFCGVDVRFEPSTIRSLVAAAKTKKKQMVCVLPWRAAKAKGFALTQAVRYWWELAPPRRLFRRPPVLSTCWLITKTALERAGGFAACRRTIVPEAYFARQLIAADGYSFLRASDQLGLTSLKGTKDQQETAVRTRYPQLHRRPENTFLLSLSEVFFLAGPFVLTAASLLGLHIGLTAQVCALLAAALLAISYEAMSLSTRTGNWWFGLVGMPVGALYDISLIHYSMWQYEFQDIEWKGRNVCIPAMHVVPHLPKLD